MRRILVIDDESRVRSAITIALEANDCSVLAFETGQAALRELEKSNFDLAIVDVFMPGMDGMTLINALRERVSNLPIVAISGGEEGKAALDFLTWAPGLSGITCLQKPFRQTDLMQAMHEAKRKAA
jgi:CheY-like chemotaxis protein